ncbi:MAG TPA: mechanosensitive ion channel domain-containing protein [Methylomirabilota bacterium]|nr:mechanosensitive ion channel domain-containing protein [Methylomirabilota bacterium]
MEFVSADIQRLLTGIAGTVAQSAGRLALALVGGFILARVLRMLLVQLERVLVRAGERTGALAAVTRSRVATLTSVLRTLALVVLWSVVAVVCLSQLGLDVRPILAGAGIVGLAVGFGAQYLVRDVIAGFFLVLEDQVRVGDVAVVNGTGGLVETVTFRTIVLRDLAGTLHIFQNGAVTTLANMTRGWSGYVVDVEVSFREDPDRVIAVMRRVGDELRADPAHGPLILEPIEVFGVDGFKEASLVIKARLKTLPIQQWTVGREYRRRLVQALAAEGIDNPARVLQVGDAGKPLPVLLMRADASDQQVPVPR